MPVAVMNIIPLREISPEREEIDKILILQHIFLQTFLCRPCLSFNCLQLLYFQLAKTVKVTEPDAFPTFIDKVGVQIELVGLEIKRTQDQFTGEIILVLINTTADDVAKLGTEFTPQEISYVNKIIEKIVTTPGYKFARPLIEILAAASETTPVITKSAAQPIITSLLAKGWLNISSKRLVTLSTRAIAELSLYLKEMYGDDAEEEEETPLSEMVYVECLACTRFVTIGWRCSYADCGIRMHRHCAKVKLAGKKECPQCKRDWKICPITGDVIGERVGPTDEEFGVAGDYVGEVGEEGERANNDDDEEEEEDELDDTVATKSKSKEKKQQQKKKKGTTRSSGRKRTQDEDEDEDSEMEE